MKFKYKCPVCKKEFEYEYDLDKIEDETTLTCLSCGNTRKILKETLTSFDNMNNSDGKLNEMLNEMLCNFDGFSTNSPNDNDDSYINISELLPLLSDFFKTQKNEDAKIRSRYVNDSRVVIYEYEEEDYSILLGENVSNNQYIEKQFKSNLKKMKKKYNNMTTYTNDKIPNGEYVVLYNTNEVPRSVKSAIEQMTSKDFDFNISDFDFLRTNVENRSYENDVNNKGKDKKPDNNKILKILLAILVVVLIIKIISLL